MDVLVYTEKSHLLPPHIEKRMEQIWAKIFPRSYANECLIQLSMTWPTIITSMCSYVTISVSIMMCGHDKLQFDAAALANSLINVFGVAVNLGFSTACDTFFSQTIGSTNKKRTGLYLQQAFIVISPVLVIMSIIYLNIEPILVYIGQDPEISKMTADYLLHFLPGIYFDCGFIILARYLQNQNLVFPPMLAGLTSVLVNIVGQYVAIYVFHQNYLASAVCQAISFASGFFFELIYIVVSKVYKDTWDGWKFVEMWWNLESFYILGIAGIFLVALDEWGFEVGVFISGTLGATQLGAQSIILQMETLSFMIPLGLSVIVNIRVGNCLGAGDYIGARHVFRVATTLILISSTCMALLFLTCSTQLASIYTSEEDVIATAASVIPYISALQYLDGISTMASGALVGCGRQVHITILELILFYFLTLPVVYYLAVKMSLEVIGIWLGLIFGSILKTSVYLVLVHYVDWEFESKVAKIRAGEVSDSKDLPLVVNNPPPILLRSKWPLIKRLLPYIALVVLLFLAVRYRHTSSVN